MTSSVLSFDHVQIISKEPDKSAQWYVDMLDARMTSEQQVRGALQVGVEQEGLQSYFVASGSGKTRI